jgi:hypothetical protein
VTAIDSTDPPLPSYHTSKGYPIVSLRSCPLRGQALIRSLAVGSFLSLTVSERRGSAMGLEGGSGCAGSSAMGDIWGAAEVGDDPEVERLIGADPRLLDKQDGEGKTPRP